MLYEKGAIMMSDLRVLTTIKQPRIKRVKQQTALVQEISLTSLSQIWDVPISTLSRWTKLKSDPLPSKKVVGKRLIEVEKAVKWRKRREQNGK
ncbi:hypothetical protein IV56_GL001901 [Lacticaseibacillus saniviri JCM 17471 = DSM 24301]|uniref:Uncharacterized protein n=1 Tax=Lacticaseibacillus saniviri JCM 17471 = DSM 24301 TaxID=1293598 RepID=A0A0R2MRF2_9LACO|nr:hypothetical protein IV56_GL001901 [Lacticaseibacillus saniviri JCM 17471 = DSM 24301]